MTTDTDGQRDDGAEHSTDAGRGVPTRAIVVGADSDGLGDALETHIDVSYVDGTGTRDDLEAVGITDGDLLVVTDVGLTTSIPVARELADVRVVVYSRDSVPEFVRGRQALIVDPALIPPETVAEELVS